ncbi:MAG: rhomboid family intramembrane serine protease [Pseudomonadota bacterium]
MGPAAGIFGISRCMNHIPKLPDRDPEPLFGRRRSSGPSGREPFFNRRSSSGPSGREPIFTMPTSVIAMIAILAGIHLIRSGLPQRTDIAVLEWFAFIPARYLPSFAPWPGGIGADLWTFLTYALLHGSTMHIITNAIWLVAFGSAVAWRFGAFRFFTFSALCAVGGATAHLLTHYGEAVPVVGASAAIAGQMAGAARFVFDRNGPLFFSQSMDARFRRPARSLVETLSNKTALVFILIWFAINVAVGLGGSFGGGVSVAWEAHLGGFITGLLAFRLFDPVPR